MYKSAFYIVLFFFLDLSGIAQNLVPNPSFEEFTNCPDDLNQVSYATGWSSFGNTPDYYNSCFINGGSWVDVPYNYNGFQYAADGQAYAGFIAYGEDGTNYREFIGAELKSPLIAGTTYCVSLQLNFPFRQGEQGETCWNTAIKNVGIRFTNALYSENLPHPTDNYCHVCSDVYISDTTYWVQVKGNFTADQPYKYLVIGNFFDEQNTEKLYLFPPTACGNGSSYFVDNIIVSADVEGCNLNIEFPNVFTPNNDGINDLWLTHEKIVDATIMNRWGNTVFESKNGFLGWDGDNQSGNPCSDGVYFYFLIREDPITKERTKHSGFITLLRE